MLFYKLIPKFDVTWKQVPPLLQTFDPLQNINLDIVVKVVREVACVEELEVNGLIVVIPDDISHKFP